MHIFTVVAAFSVFFRNGCGRLSAKLGGKKARATTHHIRGGGLLRGGGGKKGSVRCWVLRGFFSRCFLFREQTKIRDNRNMGEIRQNEPKIHAFGVRRVGSDRRRAKKWGTGALKRWKTVTSIQIALCGLRPQRAAYEFGS